MITTRKIHNLFDLIVINIYDFKTLFNLITIQLLTKLIYLNIIILFYWILFNLIILFIAHYLIKTVQIIFHKSITSLVLFKLFFVKYLFLSWVKCEVWKNVRYYLLIMSYFLNNTLNKYILGIICIVINYYNYYLHSIL